MEGSVTQGQQPDERLQGQGPEQHPEGEPSEVEAAIGEVEDKWRRAVADLDNLRKRYARELDRERQNEQARVAGAWLPVLDNLELAVAHSEADASLLAGLEAVRDQAVSVLGALGYPRDDEKGVPFDPARHEVVEVVEGPQDAEGAEPPPGTVVRVVRPGYGVAGRQLRPASVAVVRQG